MSTAVTRTPEGDKIFDELFLGGAESNLRQTTESGIQESVRQGTSWGETALEVLTALPQGAQEGMDSVMAVGWNSARYLDESLTGRPKGQYIGMNPDATPVEKTALGQAANAIGQQLPFSYGLGASLNAGRAAWAASAARGAKFASSFAGKALTSLTAEGISGALAFTGNEPKLMDLAAQLGPEGNFIQEYLATDLDDSEAWNRFRNGVDNSVADVAVNGLLKLAGIGITKVRMRKAGATEEAISAATKDQVRALAEENPALQEHVDAILRADSKITEEEAWTTLTGVLTKAAQEDGRTVEQIAKLFSFRAGANEMKHSLALPAPGQDVVGRVARRANAAARAAGVAQPAGTDTLITPQAGTDLVHLPREQKQFAAWLREQGTVQPSSGQTIVTPPPARDANGSIITPPPQARPLLRAPVEGEVMPDEPPAGDVVDAVFTSQATLPAPVIVEPKMLPAPGEAWFNKFADTLFDDVQPDASPAARQLKDAFAKSETLKWIEKNAEGRPAVAPRSSTVADAESPQPLKRGRLRKTKAKAPANSIDPTPFNPKIDGELVDDSMNIDFAKDPAAKEAYDSAVRQGKTPQQAYDDAMEVATEFADDRELFDQYEQARQAYPIAGNVIRATAGLSGPERTVFEMVRVEAVDRGMRIEPQDAVVFLKAAAVVERNAELKAAMVAVTPARAEELLNRVRDYYSRDPAKADAAFRFGTQIEARATDNPTLPTADNASSAKTPDAEADRINFSDIGVDKATADAEAKAMGIDRNRLFQEVDGVKQGYVQFDNLDGRAVIGLFNTANVSTLVHELTHVLDRLNVAPELFVRVRQRLGLSMDDISRDASERIARAFERAAFEGEFDGMSKTHARKLSDFMHAVYRDVENSPLGRGIPKEIRYAFRRLGGTAGMQLNTGIQPEIEQFQKDVAEMTAKGTTFPELQARLDAELETHLNLSTVRSTDAAMVVGKLHSILEEAILTDRGGVRHLDESIKDAIGVTTQLTGDFRLLDLLKQDAQTADDLSRRILGYQTIRNSLAAKQAEIIRRLVATPDDEGLQVAGQAVSQMLASTHSLVNHIKTATGRMLQIQGKTLPDIEVGDELLTDWNKFYMNRSGRLVLDPDKLSKFIEAMDAAGGDPVATGRARDLISRLFQAGKKLHLWDKVMTYWTANLLSNPRTFIGTQVLSGGLMTAATPVYHILGGAWKAIVQRDRSQAQFGVKLLCNLWETMWDGVNAIGTGGKDDWLGAVVTTFKRNDSVLEPTAFSQKLVEGNTPAAVVANGVWSVVTSPFRVMRTIDEFTKQLNARAYLRSRGMEEAFARGLDKDTKAFDAFVTKYVADSLTDSGALVDAEAARFVNELTFTSPLQPGTFLGRMDRLVKDTPILRVFQPFFRAPANITRVGFLESTPLGLLFPSIHRKLRSADPHIQAEMIGKMMTGTMFMGLAGVLYANGNITGKGPRDPKERQAWLDAGYQPYSFVIRGEDGRVTSVSYLQAEPIATAMGLMTNALERIDELEDGDDRTLDTIFAAGVLGVGDTWSNKNFLQGLAQFFRVTSGSADSGTANRLKDMIAKFVVPMSGGLSATSDAAFSTDMTRVEGMFDRIQAQAGYTANLPPKRDWFGEPRSGRGLNAITPVPIRQSTDDPARLELVRLADHLPGISSALPPKLRTLNLTEYTNDKGVNAFDRYGELRQTMRDGGGFTLHEAITRLIQSSKYAKAGREVRPEEAQSKLIEEIHYQFKGRIEQQILREFPKLRQDVAAARPEQNGFGGVLGLPK